MIWISQGTQQNQQYHGIEDQVPDAEQDGASADMAAEAAAVGVEPRPGATIFIARAAGAVARLCAQVRRSFGRRS